MGLNCWRQSSLMSSYINFNSDYFGKEQAACSPCFSHNWKYFFFLSFNDTGTQSSLFNHHFMALDYSRDSCSIGYDKTMTPPFPSLKNKEGEVCRKRTEVNCINFPNVVWLATFFCKGSSRAFFRFSRPYALSHIYLFLWLWCESSHRKKIIHTGLWMCSITTL